MKNLKMTALDTMNLEALNQSDVLLVTGGCGSDTVQEFVSETVTKYTDQDGNISVILDKTRTIRTICSSSSSRTN